MQERGFCDMFLDDDLEPKNQPKKPKDLSKFSVTDLEEYIEGLRAEMARAEAEKQKKLAHMNAASSLFKSK